MNTLLMLAFMLLIVGIFAPLMSLHKFYIFNSTVSLVSAIWQLLLEHNFALFLIILLFSILLPFAKLIVLLRVWNGDFRTESRMHRVLHWISLYGKWSMLDVFVVAVLVVSVKLGSLATVVIHYGFYAFAGSVLLSMLATWWVINLIREQEAAD